MGFLFRAAFWLGIVSVFVPRDFAGDVFDMPIDASQVRFDGEGRLDACCEDRETICEAGEEAVRLGGFLTELAIDKIETAVSEHEQSSQ